MVSRSETQLRACADADLASLAVIYADAIRHLGPRHYTAAQVAAWAAFADDAGRFRQWVVSAATTVAVDDQDQAVGFAGLIDPGHVASLFVAPPWQRRGVGSSLLRALLAQARERGVARITTHASEFSRPLFERFGFRVSAVEQGDVGGVTIERYAMRTET